MTFLLSLLTSRVGLLVMAAAAVLTFYEAPVLGRVAQVERAALRGYVLKTELETANAKAFELLRQREAAEAALAAFEKKQLEEDARAAIQMSRLEEEIADNEKLLSAAGRSCLVDDADVDWLSKP